MVKNPIKIADPKAENKLLLKDFKFSVENFINSDNYVNHDYIKKLEETWAAFTGLKHVCFVSNGTVALQLAYNVALRRLHANHEPVALLIPENTYHADLSAITWAGYAKGINNKIYAYDYKLGYETNNILYNEVSETKIIFNVTHLYGIPIPEHFITKTKNNLLKSDFKKRSIVIVEDCSHAHYSKVPLVGDICVWSCYPTKVLGALGNAGIIATNDDELAFYIKMLINQGEAPGIRYNPMVYGTNARGDALQAMFILEKLKHKDRVIQHRRSIVEQYESLSYSNKVTTLVNNDTTCYYVYPITVSSNKIRDQVKSELAKQQIETGIYYPVKMSNIANKLANLPSSGSFQGDNLLCLPVHLGMTTEDACQIRHALLPILDRLGR